MSTVTSETDKLKYLAECKVLFHTIYKNSVEESSFSIAELNKVDFDIDKAVQIDNEVKTYNDVQTGFNPTKLRWFHIPANNMKWVDTFMEKWFQRADGLDEANWEKMWKLKVRPGLPHPTNKPLHSRHMEPSCTMSKNPDVASRQPGNIQAHDDLDDYNYSEQHPDNTENTKPERSEDIQVYNLDNEDDQAQGSDKSEKPNESKLPLIALYLPYMNLDKFSQFSTLNQSYKLAKQQPDPPRTSLSGANREEMEYFLSLLYLRESSTLHPRRTLDQFYYSSLNDTSSRDCDQIISKWTGRDSEDGERTQAVPDSWMIMIDQLWCWVLDDETILSCFPSDEFQYKGNEFLNIYESMKSSCPGSKTVWELVSILFKEATSYLFQEKNKKILDLVDIFRGAVSKKTAEQAQSFENFNINGDHQPAAIDNLKELELVLQVADILDELKIIRNLAEKQREVLKYLILALRHLHPSRKNSSHNNGSKVTINFRRTKIEVETTKRLAGKIEGAARDTVVSADETLLLLIAEVDKLTREGENTHKMLLSLLELKQTAAALEEARSTTQQGRVIMLFTIITIIFLPLSFFTSYFGQNVSQLTGDTSNPTSWELWRVGTPISIFVIVIALLIAYRISNPSSRLWFWQRGTTNSHA